NMDWVFSDLGAAYVRLAQRQTGHLDKVKQLVETAVGAGEHIDALNREDPDKAKEDGKKAVKAYRKAVALKQKDLSWRTGLADALRMQDEKGKRQAHKAYQWVVEEAKKRDRLDSYATKDVGWCYYRLAGHDESKAESMLAEAERMTVESLA